MAIKAKEFPSRTDCDRLATLKKYQSLYDNDAFSVFGLHELIKKQFPVGQALIYLAHAIPARISDFYGDFVRGDTDNMVIMAGTGVESDEDFVKQVVYESDLKEKVYDLAVSQSEFGFCVMLGRLDDDENYIIDEVGQDQYFPQADGSVVFATWKKDPADAQGKNLLLLTQQYSMVDGKCQIECKAWKCDPAGVVQGDYSLEEMGKILGRTLVATSTLDIDELPIRQVDNGKRQRTGYGKSDYADILPQLGEVNERVSHVATQLLMTLDAKLQMPKSMFDEDGKPKFFNAYALDSNQDPEVKYVTNPNALLAEADTHVKTQLKTISFVSSVPMFELLKESMPDRVESLRIQMFQAERKTQTKRSKMKRALLDMFRIGAKMKGIKLEQDIVIKFGSVLPTDPLIDATTESTKVSAGLSSHKSAIMRLNNYNEEQAEAEMKEIKSEDAIAGVLDTKDAPQF